MEYLPFMQPEACNNVELGTLTALYGYVLFLAANLIADGSELLLLVPAMAPLVGSVVLPVLGALPDGMIVFFSGMGERHEAQEQISVGVGTLAGSTILLLTIFWVVAVYAGRVDMVNGKAVYSGRPIVVTRQQFLDQNRCPRRAADLAKQQAYGRHLPFVPIRAGSRMVFYGLRI